MRQTGAVIAAAGLSSRMGDFKPLLPFGSLSIAGHLVAMLQHAGVSPIIMVTGYRGEELELELAGSGVWFIKNPDYADTQMIDSLRLGFQKIRGHCSQVLVMPVDVPAVTEETVRCVMNTVSPIVRTRCQKRCGHPVKLDSQIIEEAIRYQGPDGLKGFLKSKQDFITDVNVVDEGSFLDADTRAEYRRLLELNGGRGQGYPDGTTLRWLWETSTMPEAVKRHSQAVSQKALSMAMQLGRAGIGLNRDLIRSAALLHDIGKGRPDHALLGGEILKKNGYLRAGEIVRQHHDLDRIPMQMDETVVVYLADKMIQGEAEVSVEERFKRSRTKCTGSKEALESHEKRHRQALDVWRLWERSIR